MDRQDGTQLLNTKYIQKKSHLTKNSSQSNPMPGQRAKASRTSGITSEWEPHNFYEGFIPDMYKYTHTENSLR